MRRIVCIAAMLFLTGCTQRLTDFTMISSKNIDWSHGAEFTRLPQRVRGEDMYPMIIFIPLGVPNPKEAVDKAIESVPGCVGLLDGVLYNKVWIIPFIYGQSSWIVEGTPLIDPQLK